MTAGNAAWLTAFYQEVSPIYQNLFKLCRKTDVVTLTTSLLLLLQDALDITQLLVGQQEHGSGGR